MQGESLGAKFEELVEIMSSLRGVNGCPWDKEQNLNTLKPLLIEEVYEVIEAVDTQDYMNLSEELGDVLFHIVFHARLCEEEGEFAIDRVIEGICEKLVRRHPHVFGTSQVSDSEQVLENWEAIKAKEKKEHGLTKNENYSILDGLPSKLPALHEAHKLSSRVARVGFDWSQIDDVFKKLQEEIGELRGAMSNLGSDDMHEEIEGEIGDVFFVLVNIARFLNVDSESALKKSNRKFRSRFHYIERALADEGKSIDQASLGDMEAMWQEAKQLER